MDSFIQFKDVKKTYKVGDIEIHASNGVNFEVNKGEFVVIVGLISVIERQIMKKEAQRHGIVSTFAQLFL